MTLAADGVGLDTSLDFFFAMSPYTTRVNAELRFAEHQKRDISQTCTGSTCA
jgi:hypothetical protein